MSCAGWVGRCAVTRGFMKFRDLAVSNDFCRGYRKEGGINATRARLSKPLLWRGYPFFDSLPADGRRDAVLRLGSAVGVLQREMVQRNRRLYAFS